MGLYKSPGPVCLTEKLLSFYFFPMLGLIVVRDGFSSFFSQLKPNVLHFRAHKDIILWRRIITQTHIEI